MELQPIKNIILDEKNKDFLIFCHQSPDGDAIGSALATKFLLETQNKNVRVITFEKLPLKYNFMGGFSEIENFPNDKAIKADVAMFMESSSVKRTGYDEKLLNVKKIINIDHHKINDNFGDVNWVDSEYCAACEMIYEIFEFMNVDICEKCAECLYVGILTDTGRFQYSNMKLEIYDILKKLVSKGVDVNFIYRQIYGSRPKSYIGFMRIFLNNLEFYKSDMVAVSYIEQKQIDLNSITDEDFGGAVDFLRDIEGVELACFIKPKKEHNYKVSLRSKKAVSVTEFAKIFGGGGHKYASGFDIAAKTILEAKDKVLEVILKEEFWC